MVEWIWWRKKNTIEEQIDNECGFLSHLTFISFIYIICLQDTLSLKLLTLKQFNFHLQSFDRRDFSKGLRPEHAGQTVVSRTASESSQVGATTPSLPQSPVSPRSPLINPHSPYGSPCSSPGPFRRSNSPRRQPLDVGFASAVTNICEQAHTIAEEDRRMKYKGGEKRITVI